MSTAIDLTACFTPNDKTCSECLRASDAVCFCCVEGRKCTLSGCYNAKQMKLCTEANCSYTAADLPEMCEMRALVFQVTGETSSASLYPAGCGGSGERTGCVSSIDFIDRNVYLMPFLGSTLNHSCFPNTVIEQWDNDGSPLHVLKSIRPIFRGDGITLDHHFENIPASCLCGVRVTCDHFMVLPNVG